MPLDVIGLGIDLHQQPPSVVDRLAACSLLVGGQRMLQACRDYPGRQVRIKAPLDQVLAEIKTALAQGAQVGVLADGDPLFYGIGRRLLREFEPEALRFHPGITALQAAAARLKIPWDQVRIVSLHGRPDIHPVLQAVSKHHMVGVYTDATWTPKALAQTLLERDMEHMILHVCEDMHLPSESIRSLSCFQAVEMRFSPLNFVLLQRTKAPQVELSLGTPEEHFVHTQGLITKAEIRSTALGCLQLQPEHTVWDIGAGCGSIGLEAALLAREGRVVCVEADPTRAEHIHQNRARTGMYALDIVARPAPVCFSQLPAPDRIVIGGGLGRTPDLLPQALEYLRPGGRIVVLCTLLASLTRARQDLHQAGLQVCVHQVQVARSQPIGTDERLAPLNPVFVLTADKANL